MNQTIEFVLRMRDMMSSNITRVSSSSQSAFNRMSQSANQVTGRNRILAMSFNELQTKIKDVESTIARSTIPSQISAARRELAALQRQSTRHSGNISGATGSSSSGIGIGGVAIGTMLGNAGMMAISTIGSGISAAVTKSMEKESAITGLTTFLGKDRAATAYKNIRNDANVTPFDTTTLLGANRSLISANVDEKTARKDVMNLGNAVSATSDGANMAEVMRRMAQNLQQIKNVGSATGMDIKQFAFAGININEALKRSGQKTDGKITYEMITKALEMANSKGGMYEGAMAAQSQTKAGKMSTVQDKLGNAASDIGDAFSPLIHKFLDQGISFLDGLPQMLAKAQPLISSISNGVSAVVDSLAWGISNVMSFAGWLASGSTGADTFTIAVGALAGGLLALSLGSKAVAFYTMLMGEATGFAAIQQWILNSAMLANPIGLVIIGISALVAGIAIAYVKFAGFRAMVDGLWAVLKEVGALLKAVFTFDFAAIPKIISTIATGDAYSKARDQSLMATAAARHKSIKEANTQREIDKRAALVTNTNLTTKNEASGKAAGDTVAGAGPKVVNIHVGKFFDNLQFTTLNAGESANEIEKIVMECFARVVYNGSKMV